MLGRIYSIALSAITAEALVNGFGQLEFLNPIIFWTSVSLTVVVVIGVVFSQWMVPSDGKFWLYAVSILALVLIVTWPLHFDSTQVTPAFFQPWIWWPLGIAAIAAGTTFRFSLGVVYVLVMTVSWPLLKISGFGGSADPLLAFQEALHLFVFSSVLIAMVLALRWEAGKTDAANQKAISSAVESAKLDAVEIERSRLDALVHDSVLTTLLIAARAETPEQLATASKSASDAISRLSGARAGGVHLGQVTLNSFFEALELRVRGLDYKFEVSVHRVNDLPIPSDVAEALTEATLQAVDNSLKHGGRASQRWVRLRGNKAGLKIVISDNGKGFRPAQIPKDRMGISASIIGRVKTIGGRVFINASPGQGTTVVIEWGSND